MDLKEAKEYFGQQLQEKLDDFIEEYGYEYVVPSPLESPEIQIKRLRDEMHYKLTFKEYDTTKGMELVVDYLPQKISPEEWERVQDEFRQVEEHALEYLNSEEARDANSPIRPTYQVLGLSLDTYEHCKELLYDFVRQEDYQNVQDLSYFLISFYQDRLEPWLGAGRSFDFFREYHRAIEIYENIHIMFPNDPLSYIFCSLSHLMLREPSEAKDQLEKAEQLLENEPKMKEAWCSTVEDIKKML